MTSGRLIALACALATVLVARPAAACKLDSLRRFQAQGPLVVGSAIPFHVEAHVEHAGSPPVGFPFGCSPGASLVVSVTGVPPGEWGMLVTGDDARALGVPAVPFEMHVSSPYPTNVVLEQDTNAFVASGYHGRLALQLVARDGTMTPPVYVVVDGPWRLRWGGWLLLIAGAIVGAWLYRHRHGANPRPPPPPLPRATSLPE